MMGPRYADDQTGLVDEQTPLNASFGPASSGRSRSNRIDRFTRLTFLSSLRTRVQGRWLGNNDSSVSYVGVSGHLIDLAGDESSSSNGNLDPGQSLYAPPALPSSKSPEINGIIRISSSEIEPPTTSIPNTTDDIPADDRGQINGDPRFIGISPRRFWAIFFAIMLAYFLACFDSTLMASSHPVITSYFNASQAASWLSTVFLITSTAFQPLFGRLSDMVGRKTVMLLTLGIFLLTTLWCALAPTIESFIAARAVCGIGAGGTMSLCLIVTSDLVRIEHRGVFQSHINIAFGAGSAAGAAFGGFLCDKLGWRWAFGVQVPAMALCLMVATFASPRDLGPMLIKQGDGNTWTAFKSFDFMGSLLLVITVTCLILALNLGGSFLPWTHPLIITFIVAFLVAATFFAVVENRVQHPLMPLRLLTRTPIANLVFANFLGNMATNTVRFNAPLFFQAVMLTSASTSGFRLAIPGLVDSLAGIATGYIITYTCRLKPTLVLGGVIYLIGSLLVLLLTRHTSEVMSMVLIAGVPLGQGFVLPNTIMSALAVSDQSVQAVITTTIGLWRTLGSVVGVALSSLVFQNALLFNLRRTVTGPSREAIIEAVRSSVKSIRQLDPASRDQVITAYADSLRSAFLCALVAAVLVNCLILPIRLPRLKPSDKTDSSTAE